MTQPIDSISAIADQFDAIVLDQWGVLHDGRAPYPAALATLEMLGATAVKIGVLSNSGKRAAPNMDRIARMGFDRAAFDCLMTSGEALWRNFASGEASARMVYPIVGRAGDAEAWADGLPLTVTDDIAAADAVLLMGLPDDSAVDAYDDALHAALTLELPLYCSNPDYTSPRGDGRYVISPGALARSYRDMGGGVHLYGKPHRPVFAALEKALDCAPSRILMVGDSLHHDIAGAQMAGWASLLIRGGVHAPDLRADDVVADIARLARAENVAPPDYTLPDLR